MSNYFDRDGRPLDLWSWAQLLEREGYKLVRRDEAGGVLVSTVWLGIDYRLGGGPPLIFETMVFRGGTDVDCHRYSTEAAAVAGHELLVELYLAATPDPGGA